MNYNPFGTVQFTVVIETKLHELCSIGVVLKDLFSLINNNAVREINNVFIKLSEIYIVIICIMYVLL